MQLLIQPSAPFFDLHAFVDASSGFGIGLVLNNAWASYKFITSFRARGRDIAWAESIAVYLMLLTFTHIKLPSTRLIIYCDNKVVVEGWRNFRSRNTFVNSVFQNYAHILQFYGWQLSLQYIPSAKNPADKPSRGLGCSGPSLPPISIPPFLNSDLQHCSFFSNSSYLSSTLSPSSFILGLDPVLDYSYEQA